MATNAYATDGRCHNSEGGSYNHECHKPATWLGTDRNNFVSGFCDDCKRHGREARGMATWQRLGELAAPTQPTLF
jgi:hypothetical protein